MKERMSTPPSLSSLSLLNVGCSRLLCFHSSCLGILRFSVINILRTCRDNSCLFVAAFYTSTSCVCSFPHRVSSHGLIYSPFVICDQTVLFQNHERPVPLIGPGLLAIWEQKASLCGSNHFHSELKNKRKHAESNTLMVRNSVCKQMI